ncbi:cell wall hydrolyses involved in spore germination [Brevibacillus panacihumi W25]|uniref:Cell wall hydrolyses involved in spore germination n=1 Tax=Brevibacillus panacihumi W25 TaxID=1408254 RepID=V6M165_9BACL|nr:cell wall hydrolase [Brevibacillus panacihumi]EST52411.1 cell wall hydrolyses involved in spore germination [Brevibacillus panacihumi W25]
MFPREAQMRFFFYINSIGLLLLCLFVTPTSAQAPKALSLAGPSDPATMDSLKTPKTNSTTLHASQSERKAVQVSRGDSRTRTVNPHGHARITEREMELLARLVYAEGRGEPYEGQVAIAAVVLNRVSSPQFPDTVQEVIFAPRAFSPVRGGKLPFKANESTRKAAREAVAGADPTNGSLYFFNPNTATSEWIWSRTQTVRIANHIFAK